MHDYDVMAYAEYVGNLLGGGPGYFLGSSAPPGQPALFRMKPHHGRRMRGRRRGSWRAEQRARRILHASLPLLSFSARRRSSWSTTTARPVKRRSTRARCSEPGASCRDGLFAAFNDYMRGRGHAPEKRLHCHGQGYENVERPLIRDDEDDEALGPA